MIHFVVLRFVRGGVKNVGALRSEQMVHLQLCRDGAHDEAAYSTDLNSFPREIIRRGSLPE